MKIILASLLTIYGFTAAAVTKKNPSVSSPPNAVSRGQSEEAGISDSPTGTNAEERELMETEAESMGGAPNAGGGMGTGTGAGSTVGHDVDDEDDTITPGAED